MTQWYYAQGGSQHGPVPAEQLGDLLRGGQLAPSDLTWRDGMADWLPAGHVPELVNYLPAMPSGAPATVGYAPASPGYPAGPAVPGYEQHPGYAAPQLGYAQPQPYAGSPVPGAYPGGFWWRVLAYIIDYAILWVPNFAIQAGLEAALGGVRPRPGGGLPPEFWAIIGLGWAAQVALAWLYFALQESSAAQATLGKRACGLVVTDANGGRIGFGQATGRYFGKILSGLILGIGFLMVAFDARKRSLHDQLAKTLVWKKP